MAEEKLSTERVILEWEKDAFIDPMDLDRSSIKIASIHQKYLNYYNKFAKAARVIRRQLKEKRREKAEFYTGNGVPEAYRDNPFSRKLAKSELPNVIENDASVADLATQLEGYEHGVAVCKMIIKQLDDRTWQIRNAVDFAKHLSGS